MWFGVHQRLSSSSMTDNITTNDDGDENVVHHEQPPQMKPTLPSNNVCSTLKKSSVQSDSSFPINNIGHRQKRSSIISALLINIIVIIVLNVTTTLSASKPNVQKFSILNSLNNYKIHHYNIVNQNFTSASPSSSTSSSSESNEIIIIEEHVPNFHRKKFINYSNVDDDEDDNRTLIRKRRNYETSAPPNSELQHLSLGYNQMVPDRGPWAPWTDLSECTKSCGGGVYFQTRVCLASKSMCEGPTKRYFSCNMQNCPEGSEDFRSNQCARFNRVPFDGVYYNWKPFYKAGDENPCELKCKPESQRWYYRHARKVIDGTRCYDDDSNNICVDGFCVELGCDRVLGSTVKEDNCRVCGGDGSSCRRVTGVYEQTQGLRMGYNDILYIPAGSTNIQIQEVRPTNNYLAIRNQQGRSYLNGKWRIQPPATYDIAGTKFHYERPHGSDRSFVPEKLRALGPTNEPLFIQLLHQEQNQGISYDYSTPFTNEPYGELPPVAQAGPGDHSAAGDPRRKGYPRYVWIFGDFSPCSKQCGTGVQQRQVYCASMNHRTGRQEQVSDSLCDSAKRPPDTRQCRNEKPCEAQWQHGNWSECSCLHRVQYRNVYCSGGQERTTCQLSNGSIPVAPDSECEHQPKPESVQKCQPDLDKCPQWAVGEWTKCDAKCGVGKQTRKVRCTKSKMPPNVESSADADSTSTVAATTSAQTTTVTSSTDDSTTVASEDKEAPPTTTAAAASGGDESTSPPTTTQMVPQDQVLQPAKRETKADDDAPAHDNEDCNNKCELNSDDEEYVEDYLCDPDTKPAEEQSCSLRPCEDLGSVEWVTSAWTSCDQDCGPQTQTRQVACVSRDGQVFPDQTCLERRGERPADTQDCPDGSVCSRSQWFTSEWSECSVKCGLGTQTRHVFCGHVEGGTVTKDDDESKCILETKPTKTTVCQQAACEMGEWFQGPSGPCSVPCGGGQKKRQQFCLKPKQNGSEWELEPSEQCSTDSDSITGSADSMKSEDCNVQACDADQLAAIVDCKDTEFGCCPSDHSTPAEEDYKNCPLVNVDSVDKCEQSEFGCCPIDDDEEIKTGEDSTGAPPAPESSSGNLTLALGPYGLGCPVRCANTQFGCCPDMVTVANSSDMSECPMDETTTTTMMTTTMEATTTTTMMPTTTEMQQTTTDIPLASMAKKCADDDLECVMSTTQSSMVKDCSKSEFGCCPDGWNAASGPNGEGCEEGSGDLSSFISSTISSVMSMFTTGTPEDSTIPTDCNLTEFGCCPNGKTRATGPRFYGCTCHDYPFGCCQDGFSPASGENLEGCLCERMLYGCCPDGRTPATGPNQEGCDCESSAYGCCSDMVTFAQGPNYHGCPCETMTYGCCPGSQIPARGPDFAGCSCADTPFGCCTDGVTVAYGPKFEGCPSGLPLDTKLNSEVCKLKMEAGPCSNFSVRWFFDNEYGTCNRFWYGGCQGNGNRFSSQEQCERSCVKPEGPERCLLPKITGPCNSSVEAFYYNGETRRCEQFMYGGCLGNTNRFETMDQCVQTCIYQENALNQCEQPVKPGPCRGNYRRWYYRREEGRCREFSYGGCQGNLNNFQTEDECQSACASRSPFEICMLPRAQGSCLGTFPRWYFDAHSGVCQEFTYSGCEGNMNRFVDRISCEKLCNETIPDYYYPSRAQHPPPSQQQYPHGPQPHPGYPPVHENEIIVAPGAPQTATYENVCALPQAHGPCRENIIQWYFDVTTRRCERFYYGGCGGNDNRFNDREECEHKCLSYAQQTPAEQDPCLEPKDLGDPQCQDYRHRWYYDVEDRRCHRFYYYGCGGNRNNFESEDDCTARCVTPRQRQDYARQWPGYGRPDEQQRPSGQATGGASTDAARHHDPHMMTTDIQQFQQEHCFNQHDSGPCEMNHIQWYYDSRDGVCKEFIYGGCGGNQNRFHSQQECQTKCWNSQDICKLSPVRGSCSANFTQWYYDHQNNECYEFEFSGCLGNANRFSSKDTCEQQCKTETSGSSQQQPNQIDQQQQQHRQQLQQPPQQHSTPSGGDGGAIPPVGQQYAGQQQQPEKCRMPKDTGMCRGYFPQYYYNSDDGQCQMFIYGGCGGNENRFATAEECERTCQQPKMHDSDYPEEPREGVDLPEVVCFLKMDTGPCHETQAKWWFDPDSHTCFPFVYGGCRGNKNRFPDFDQCMRFCMGVSRASQMYGGHMPPSMHQQPQLPPASTSEPPIHQPYPYRPPGQSQPQPPPTSDQSHCEPMECNEENCILGIDYYHDSRGCPACRCVNPCNDIRCSEDMSCSVELYREHPSGKIRANAECRLRVKPGQCPSNMLYMIPESERENSPECYDQCRTDADCRNSDKCCNNGCANVCVSPEDSTATIHQQPQPPHAQQQSPNMTTSTTSGAHYQPPPVQQTNYYNYSVDNQQQQQSQSQPDQQPAHHADYPNGQNVPIQTADQHVYHHTDMNGQQQQPGYPYDQNYPQQPQPHQTSQQQPSYPHDPRYYPNGYDQHQQQAGQHANNTDSSYPPHYPPYDQMNGSPEHANYPPSGEYPYDSNGDGEARLTNQGPPPQTYPTILLNANQDQEYVLDCPLANGENQSPEQPAWSKNGLYIDLQDDHYEILPNGSLKIKNLQPDDRGMFGCMMRGSPTTADNVPQIAYIPLEFTKPAQIMPGAKRVIAAIGMPTYLHCQVNGYPEPNVTWRRGEQVLPVNSAKYQQMPNKTLIIQQVDQNDAGMYSCLASNENGEDRADVELLLDEHTGGQSSPSQQSSASAASGSASVSGTSNGEHVDDIVPYDPNLFGNNNNNQAQHPADYNYNYQQPQQQSSQYSAPSSGYPYNQQQTPDGDRGGQSSSGYPNEYHHQMNNYYPHAPPPAQVPMPASFDQDPITTEIEYWPKDYRIGSVLHMDCVVKNQRTGQVLPNVPNVVWYINSDIPLLVDETNRHHYMIMPNNTLLIYHLNRGDSGEYRCRANTGPQGDSYSSVQLQVEDIPIPADCQDNPIFAHCAMIVQNNYCRNSHYHNFCCRSCYIAEHKQKKAQAQAQALVESQQQY